MIIGICGKMCSGKSIVASYFVERGYTLIDVDVFGHQALEIHRQQIIDTFGSSIVSGNTTGYTSEKTDTNPPAIIDRKKLAQLVFHSNHQLHALERIVHPTMISNIQDAVHHHSGSDIVIDAALLYRLNLHLLCDVVFFVYTNLLNRIQRYRARTGGGMWSIWRAMRIIRSQRYISVNNLDANVDTVIVRNNRSERELCATIAQYMVR